MIYRGSKEKFSKDIVSFILTCMNDREQFVDLFCGGCNVISQIPNHYTRIANDMNPYLISMMSYLVKDCEHRHTDNGIDLDDDECIFTAPVTQAMYEQAKERMKNENPNNLSITKSRAYLGWCGFIGSESGIFFKNFCGKTSRSAKDTTYFNAREARKTAELLQGVHFTCSDYKDFVFTKPSVIYCDPPWKGTRPYVDSSYKYDEFVEWCFRMTEQGHTVLVSEVSMPEGFKLVSRHGALPTDPALYLCVKRVSKPNTKTNASEETQVVSEAQEAHDTSVQNTVSKATTQTEKVTAFNFNVDVNLSQEELLNRLRKLYEQYPDLTMEQIEQNGILKAFEHIISKRKSTLH